MGTEEQRPSRAANRLLIVDDEPDITRLLDTIARSVDFEVLAINDSNQFEKALGQIDPQYLP